MNEPKLTRKEAQFVAELQDPNITQREATIRAGFSVKNADSIASRLLKKSQVSEAIEKAVKAKLEKIGVQAEKVLTRMAELAFADIRKIFGANGVLLSPEEWPEDVFPTIAGVETFEEYEGKGENKKYIGRTRKVRLWDPNPSLTNLAKYLELFPTQKRGEGEIKEPVPITNLELSAKILYLLQLAIKKKKERKQREQEQITVK